MKMEQKKKAICLRKKGASITKIAKILHVSKGSVSRWVREVILDNKVLEQISKRSHSASVVEKRRLARIKNENTKRDLVTNKARNYLTKITRNELFVLGIALYWGEGSKTKRGVVEFTNSDPNMIMVMKRFFKECCGVPNEKFRGHVYLHEHLDVARSEKYWSKISEISKKQFHKTSIQKNRNRVKKDTLPNGTFAIVV